MVCVILYEQHTCAKYEYSKRYQRSYSVLQITCFNLCILNDHLHYKTHTLFDTITHVSHTKISVITTTAIMLIDCCNCRFSCMCNNPSPYILKGFVVVFIQDAISSENPVVVVVDMKNKVLLKRPRGKGKYRIRQKWEKKEESLTETNE
jgi:hypothetical protein